MPIQVNLLAPTRPNPKMSPAKKPIKRIRTAVRRLKGGEKAIRALNESGEHLGSFTFEMQGKIAFSDLNHNRMVEVNKRGQGVGSRLLKKMEEDAKKAGAWQMIIKTQKASTARLLLSNGYRFKERTRGIQLFFSRNKEDIIFWKFDAEPIGVRHDYPKSITLYKKL